MATPNENILVNSVNRTIEIPHWGVTMRRLFGAALDSWVDPVAGEQRSYEVLFKNKPIATIYIQQHD